MGKIALEVVSPSCVCHNMITARDRTLALFKHKRSCPTRSQESKNADSLLLADCVSEHYQWQCLS